MKKWHKKHFAKSKQGGYYTKVYLANTAGWTKQPISIFQVFSNMDPKLYIIIYEYIMVKSAIARFGYLDPSP